MKSENVRMQRKSIVIEPKLFQ